MPDSRSTRPTVSVCIPTYNDAEHLKEMLDSIIRQDYAHIEIEIGDDASIDDTADVVAAFRDDRIRYHRNEKNLGQFPNVNALIERARGTYVAIFHSDDIYEPNIISKELAVLEANPDLGGVFSMDYRISHDGKLTGITRLPSDVPELAPLRLRDLLPALLRHKNVIMRTPSFLGRKRVFADVGYFSKDYDIAGDFEMWMRILTVYPVAILNEPLFRYRHTISQVSSQYNDSRTFEEHYFRIMDLYMNRNEVINSINPDALIEYEFHRYEDKLNRALNLAIADESAKAITLLQARFPSQTFRVRFTRRKLCVATFAAILRTALRLRLGRPCAKLIKSVDRLVSGVLRR